MLYLSFIFHQHQPYYKNLLTNETELPWVRLHGTKDYLDMVLMLERFPKIKQVFNLVPSLLEQVEDYHRHTVKDKWLELSYKPAKQLNSQDHHIILERFFSINRERVISTHPRYYELYFKKESGQHFTDQDFLDLQVWFNLAWIDPMFRQSNPVLKALVEKDRGFTEEEKKQLLDESLKILEGIIPAYRKFQEQGQIEVIVNPYYHPILPLLYNTMIAKEANLHSLLPEEGKHFAYPQDAQAQINDAISFYRERFGIAPAGMWPSEQSVCEHIIPFFLQAGLKWIVTDEGMLFKSLKHKKRSTDLLYQPHLLKRKDGEMAVIFRDRNLSDMIGFQYAQWQPKSAVDDFMHHLENIAATYKGKDILVAVAMDGENAWEYFANDGHDFLEYLYERLSDASFLQCTTISEYLKKFPPVHEIPHMAAGSWIFSDFGKWMGKPQKVKAWECLAQARNKLAEIERDPVRKGALKDAWPLIWKQMFVCEGSDWYWWYGDDQPDFDLLFRKHLINFYSLLGEEVPHYLHYPL